MQWDSTGVFWFIDGEQKGAAIKPIEIPNEPMYLIVNLAIGGGGWPGTPDSTTVFPATFDIDYVRIWTQRP
jgi:beta-glucanase (GH16 family)